MTVGVEKLVRMAEQIAANISVSTDADVVGDALAAHLTRFWDPRMRAEFVQNAAKADSELSPAVLHAIDKLKAA